MDIKSEYLNYPDIHIWIDRFAFYVTLDLQLFLMYGKINFIDIYIYI